MPLISDNPPFYRGGHCSTALMGDNRIPHDSDEEEEEHVCPELLALRERFANSAAKQRLRSQRFKAKQHQQKAEKAARDARRQLLLEAIRQQRNPRDNLYP